MGCAATWAAGVRPAAMVSAAPLRKSRREIEDMRGFCQQSRAARKPPRGYPAASSPSVPIPKFASLCGGFYASWCINRKVDGGLELPLKVVQARLGHASIQMTADTYGHLFPRSDDGAELAMAEKALLGN
jgi:integrase